MGSFPDDISLGTVFMYTRGSIFRYRRENKNHDINYSVYFGRDNILGWWIIGGEGTFYQI